MKRTLTIALITLFFNSVSFASDDKPVRSVPKGSWTQDAIPVINSLADFPADTNYWQYWGNTGGTNAANETQRSF